MTEAAATEAAVTEAAATEAAATVAPPLSTTERIEPAVKAAKDAAGLKAMRAGKNKKKVETHAGKRACWDGMTSVVCECGDLRTTLKLSDTEVLKQQSAFKKAYEAAAGGKYTNAVAANEAHNNLVRLVCVRRLCGW